MAPMMNRARAHLGHAILCGLLAAACGDAPRASGDLDASAQDTELARDADAQDSSVDDHDAGAHEQDVDAEDTDVIPTEDTEDTEDGAENDVESADTLEDAPDDANDAQTMDASDADDDADDASDGSGDADDDTSEADADADADADAGEVLNWGFREVTADSGLSGLRWMPPPLLEDLDCGESALLTGGAAIEDVDGDGALDIFLPRAEEPDQLFRNLGDARFENVAPVVGLDHAGNSNGASWVDIDGDGDLDLFVSMVSGANRLYLHPGPDLSWDAEPWEEAAERFGLDGADSMDGRGCNQSFGMSFADWDRDGDLDALLSRWGGRGTSGSSVFYECLSAAEAGAPNATYRDANEALDIDFGSANTVMFNSHFFDANGDGRLDVYTVSDFDRAIFFLQNALGGFTYANSFAGVGSEENGMGGALGDIDGDGDLDFFTTSIVGGEDTVCTLTWGCTGNRMYRSRGDGTFEDVTTQLGVRDAGWGWGPALFDADLDGDLDLAAANGYSLPFDDPRLATYAAAAEEYAAVPVRLWRNDPGGPWPDVAEAAGFVDTLETRNVLPFDADNDGDLDLLTIHNREAPRLWLSEPAADRRGVRIRVDDPERHNGLNARLVITPRDGDAPLYRWIHPYGTFSSSLPYEAHIGLLAGLTRLHRVELEYVGGARFTWEDVAIDGPQLTLRVGDGIDAP